MDRLAAVCEDVARFRPRSKKIAILAEYFCGLTDDEREQAIRFLCGEPAGNRPAVGHATFRKAMCRASGWDVETIRQCRSEVGDTGETVALLMTGVSAGVPLSLAEAARLFEELARERRVSRKVEILETCFRRHAPPALKYFVRAITRGRPIDCSRRMIEEAATGVCGPPCATLDVVVTAAGPSEFTLGVRAGEGFVNVGKARTDLDGDEVHELAGRLRAAVTERFGSVILVRPEIVLEVAFDGVKQNSRSKSGYSLVSPHIVRWRRDKRPEEADSLEQVRAFYEASLR